MSSSTVVHAGSSETFRQHQIKSMSLVESRTKAANGNAHMHDGLPHSPKIQARFRMARASFALATSAF